MFNCKGWDKLCYNFMWCHLWVAILGEYNVVTWVVIHYFRLVGYERSFDRDARYGDVIWLFFYCRYWDLGCTREIHNVAKSWLHYEKQSHPWVVGEHKIADYQFDYYEYIFDTCMALIYGGDILCCTWPKFRHIETHIIDEIHWRGRHPELGNSGSTYI
jgi:hypothetical protein